MKMTTQSLRKLKGERPIVCITAYDAPSARLADGSGIDLILVGDSVGNTVLGFETTVPVTLEMMIHHTAAVSRARTQAMVVADMPFASARGGFDEVLRASAKLMQEGGAQAVKAEGGRDLAPTVERLVQAGIPFLGHIGMLPQRIHTLGNYRRFGKTDTGREKLLEDAKSLEAAGAFAIIGEEIMPETAKLITETLSIPFIGIGCGPDCDGQILVWHDVIGLSEGHIPGFVKHFANVSKTIRDGLKNYADEVRKKTYPAIKEG